ncbi:3-oxo-5-alpha-steroid 4-dehydrogenase steroid 5-alpha-reductase [Plasmopara halstedii]|uniref:3-oxo-5-alpha-steroid 4-dehydrogenase steroid 5-alpha-reductase n=1 Tax=Plasmopara halstedii TaxID=4781 RepID=A0A0P1AJD9_PLAHL|nr:3-oxo-5-alpha-steroid 4-dehydrogenase steroid 5-alpha-reductase [Plasmopara halstedii]CEG40976.1 3-oxo-5-alpha-steroid 4-dehydrogenase steroid 5-alpha-reductase [Plasmopara halstedii]|eukprot:XP_024577345.1 3-oxo-5-alpha-steroid 4-dehydrogenase steroid 5-alpha-reductase [Plasmopara halstedii]
MRSIDVWRLTWLIAASSGLLSFQSKFCQGFVLHGKLRSSVVLSRLPLVSLLRVEVSKSLYTWFYLIGALHSIGILWIAVFYQDKPAVQKALHFAHPISNQDDNNIIALQPHTIAFLTLFSIHTTRRCLESFLITEFGKAKMHASIFFVGIYHYIATVLSVLFDPDSITSHELTTSRTMMSGLGIMIFIMASYHQSYCNYLLAQQKRANNMNHVIPRGDWFNLVRSPLYTTEIMLYIGFILVTGCTTTMLYFVSIWVVINQILLAQISSKWTETKFRDQIEKLPKWNLVPYVW